MEKKLIFLGIETSCDETAAAVIQENNSGTANILSNVVSSQIEEHKKFGGVVPELAARAHVENIDFIINKAITDGEFQQNRAYCSAIDEVVKNNKALHILGVVSEGGVHGHEDHIHGMIKLAAARGAQRVYLHAFLDGRDCPPRSAKPSLQKTREICVQTGVARIASVIGRFYAMDRDNQKATVQNETE